MNINDIYIYSHHIWKSRWIVKYNVLYCTYYSFFLLDNMFILFLFIVHSTFSQDLVAPPIFSDCKRLILPSLCQCYHSGDQSQLHCHNIKLSFIPKLPNNMHWDALDFSLNSIRSIDSYVFSDIYVEKLNLKSNHLRTIDTTGFDQIRNLKQLYIDHNKLKRFDPRALTPPGSTLGM